MNAGSLLLLLIAIGLLVMMFTRDRSQQRETSAVQSKLAPGVKVMTGGGLFATVIEVEDDVVVLETAPGQSSRWDRRAVSRIVSETESNDHSQQEETPVSPSAEKDSTADVDDSSTRET